MRRIQHPGLNHEPGVQYLATRVHTVQVHISAGQTLLDGFTKVLSQLGCQSAVATLGPTKLMPAVYVMPALSSTPDHAVYYSDKHYPAGVVRVNQGVVTVGQRNGQTWIHCHATWQEYDGRLHCGHLLPDESVLLQDMTVELSLLFDAGFVVCPDEQTHFSLFKPRKLGTHLGQNITADTVSGWCVRIAPNEDFCHALESFAAEQAQTPLKILGGVGSTVGAVFADGRVVEPFVTELLVEKGQIGLQTGQWQAELDIALVDYTGGIYQGRLARGQNPVLVTCELVVVPA